MTYHYNVLLVISLHLHLLRNSSLVYLLRVNVIFNK